MLRTLLDRLMRTQAVAIPDQLWNSTLASLPFAARLDATERSRLRALAAQLLADKQMAGAADLDLTAAMQVNIALQACLPVLNLGLDWYRGWKSIVVYPREFLVPRRITDDDGVVHEYVEPISGEAWDRGPLVLSWEDAQQTTNAAGAAYSVVIHEFVHKIDLLNGDADGLPPFSSKHTELTVDRWRRVLHEAFSRFGAELELIDSELPAGLDPESDAVDRFYTHLPFDTYAAQDEGEFFAVSSEAFFVGPTRLQQAFPEWYALLAEFFLQDPLAAKR
ncbi:MAG TPA: M90 family metallopeptidase [Burkholderiaceae bacterium]|nr:M90 family metallopeptidase [Burkholderiaceae bacterium]